MIAPISVGNGPAADESEQLPNDEQDGGMTEEKRIRT